MAKVTVTFEDIEGQEGGVNVRIESEPGFPGPAAEDQMLSSAQMMGLRMTEILAEEMQDQHGGCGHEGCDCHELPEGQSHA